MIFPTRGDFPSQPIRIISRRLISLLQALIKGWDVSVTNSQEDLDPMEKKEQLLIMLSISDELGQANITCGHNLFNQVRHMDFTVYAHAKCRKVFKRCISHNAPNCVPFTKQTSSPFFSIKVDCTLLQTRTVRTRSMHILPVDPLFIGDIG